MASVGEPEPSEAEFRKTEVEHLRLAAIGDENIRRFDIAVNDAFRVRRVERVGDVDRERQQLLERQRIAVDRFLERSAFEQLQNEKRFPVVFADLVDRADVRVAERRRRSRLAEQPLDRRGVGGSALGQKLERHSPAEDEIFGDIHVAHAAAAQLFEHPIV